MLIYIKTRIFESILLNPPRITDVGEDPAETPRSQGYHQNTQKHPADTGRVIEPTHNNQK